MEGQALMPSAQPSHFLSTKHFSRPCRSVCIPMRPGESSNDLPTSRPRHGPFGPVHDTLGERLEAAAISLKVIAVNAVMREDARTSEAVRT